MLLQHLSLLLERRLVFVAPDVWVFGERLKPDIGYSIKEGQDQEHTTSLTTKQRHNTPGLLAQGPIHEPTGVHAAEEQSETGGTIVSMRKTKVKM